MNDATALRVLDAIATVAKHADDVRELISWIARGCPSDDKPALATALPDESRAARAMRERSR